MTFRLSLNLQNISKQLQIAISSVSLPGIDFFLRTVKFPICYLLRPPSWQSFCKLPFKARILLSEYLVEQYATVCRWHTVVITHCAVRQGQQLVRCKGKTRSGPE